MIDGGYALVFSEMYVYSAAPGVFTALHFAPLVEALVVVLRYLHVDCISSF